jgi:phage gp36-like protein
MSYAQATDFEARYPARDLIQLTNEVTPLTLTFSGTPGTITLPFSPVSLVFVQSQLTQLPLTAATYVENTDYSVNRATGVITRIATGSVAAGAPVYVSADNPTYLQTFLNDASSEIDAYLESRFALPLTDPPAILVRMCCEIAMYHLQSLRPIHDMEDAKDKYEKCIKMLEDVRDRSLTLGLAVDGQEPTDPTSPAVVVDVNFGGDPSLPQRIFSRGSLKGF